MSSLTALKAPIPTKSVKVSDDESFTVRGLSPLAVFNLFYQHPDEIGALFDQAMAAAKSGDMSESDTATLLLSVLKQSPMIIAELIALASGARPEDADDWSQTVEIAKELTFPVQADALEKIGQLTFTSEMPVGKFVALVVKHMQGLTSALNPFLRV